MLEERNWVEVNYYLMGMGFVKRIQQIVSLLGSTLGTHNLDTAPFLFSLIHRKHFLQILLRI